MPHSSIQDIIPFEAFHHKKSSISHLQPFGRKCFIHIPKKQHLSGSKLMPRAEEEIFLGYTNTPCIYKVHILACNYTFFVPTLNIKFESITAGSHLGAKVTTLDVTMPNVNSASLITTILISFARPIICSMTDSQQLL